MKTTLLSILCLIFSTTYSQPKSSSLYRTCNSFPFYRGCKSVKIKEIQTLIGLPKKYRTGNFDPITEKALRDLEFDLSNGLTQNIYDELKKEVEGQYNLIDTKQNSTSPENQSQQPTLSLGDIAGIYQSDTEIIEGIHIYLMLNEKRVFVTAQGTSPEVLTDINNWMKSGSFKLIGNKIVFDYGKIFYYKGEGVINAGSFNFHFVQSL